MRSSIKAYTGYIEFLKQKSDNLH
uniref:Uncharacterized protein n=1 Tax=Rhizophora mucronata TaxID=61149 RepID=A0A2P2NFZ8_RHIMU